MQFQEIQMNISALAAGFIILSIFIPFGFIIATCVADDKPRVWLIFSSVVLAFVALFTVVTITGNVTKANDDALVSNIQQKYDVDEVLLEHRGSYIVSESLVNQTVHVSVDGQIYAFDLEQNKDTWEPTLLNPAINGGSAEVKSLSAEDLLR